MTDRSTTAAARSRLLERLRSVTAAWSVNGRDVRLVAGFDLSIEPGDLLIVTPPNGERLLVQLHELGAVSRQGITVELDPAGLGVADDRAADREPVDDFGIQRATVSLQARVVEGAGVVLGRLDGDGEVGAFDDATIEPADDDTVAAYFDGVVGGGPGLEIGTLRSSAVPARLRPKGFARHTFMCGQSGSGKTFSLGVVLERLLNETDLPVIIVDPNSDYVNLGRIDSRTAINRFAATKLSAADHAALRDRYTAHADVAVASARDGDLPLRIHLSDLTLAEQALTMQLDPLDHPDQYHALIEVHRELGDRPYDAADLDAALLARFDEASRRLAQRISNLGLADWTVWARSDESSLTDVGTDHRVLVLDTGSLADAREDLVLFKKMIAMMS